MDDLQSQIDSKDFDTYENIANLGADQEVYEEGFINVNDKVDNNTTSSKSTYTSGTSNRKNISSVWQLFDKIMVDGALKKAKCKYCQVELITGGNRGTSHLHKHATKSCPGRHLRLSPTSQTQLKIKTNDDGSNLSELGSMKKDVFNQDVSRNDLAYMVIMHEYPLSIVDHIGFRRFVFGLNSSFRMISRATLKRDIMKMYGEDKKALKALLEHNESKVSITTDMWTTSNQKKGYMVVTSHFIDQQWILRNRTLR
ncbi:unnamed protein product [Amaranthus hypochondriacus]